MPDSAASSLLPRTRRPSGRSRSRMPKSPARHSGWLHRSPELVPTTQLPISTTARRTSIPVIRDRISVHNSGLGLRKSVSNSPISYQHIAADTASLPRVRFGSCYHSIRLWSFLCGIGGTLQSIHHGCSPRTIGMAHAPPGVPSSSIGFRWNSNATLPTFPICRADIVGSSSHRCLYCAIGTILLSARRRYDHRHLDFPFAHVLPSASNSPTDL
jgi:hypothetical protein